MEKIDILKVKIKKITKEVEKMSNNYEEILVFSKKIVLVNGKCVIDDNNVNEQIYKELVEDVIPKI